MALNKIRNEPAGEHIVIALPYERTTGWHRAACNCGETIQSRAPGIVDIWATSHAEHVIVHVLERRVRQRRVACSVHMPYTGRRADDFHLCP
ncbi:MAG TPA: hypothetical protein VEI83_16160 [Acidimicrobiales bacterium]|nr:hypothetical protein [Acidimicrobiales bacterium]